MNKAILWFRNDLRLEDNKALNYASKNANEVLFVYIYDEVYEIGSASKWFLFKALQSLSKAIKHKYGAKLIIKTGNSAEVIKNLVIDNGISHVFWNKVYEPLANQIDGQIIEFCNKNEIVAKNFNSSLLFEPDSILNKSGSNFKVFTPFWKTCLLEIENLDSLVKAPKTVALVNVDKIKSLELEELDLLPTKPNWAKNWDSIYKVDEQTANSIADNFMEFRMEDYKTNRDFPAGETTSRLSPYLHFGIIGAKQLYFKTLEFKPSRGSRHFLSEIGWREFSYYLLHYFPELPKKNFNPKFDNFAWDDNEILVKKWRTGQTGFPLIDAGMRQLWQTGWMHNRIRMVVASFLIKNLLIDWRIGQSWFWDCLVDADLASNSASWQWVAGSGADAAPYFRIFNPITQSKRFDPNGEFIRQWLPELAHLSDAEIHCPTKVSDYPEPMIDLIASRNEALTIFHSLP